LYRSGDYDVRTGVIYTGQALHEQCSLGSVRCPSRNVQTFRSGHLPEPRSPE